MVTKRKQDPRSLEAYIEECHTDKKLRRLKHLKIALAVISIAGLWTVRGRAEGSAIVVILSTLVYIYMGYETSKRKADIRDNYTGL